ncbi:MAG: hypothetical protein FWE83_07985 [Oscillospiraceae bacterium]|nr:hypothetical protein [Oscillospiraceae bacterium]
MKGEKVFFRKKLFGGFNREDVVVYIAKIAEERNEAITAKEKAEKEVSKLTRELQIMRGEMPDPEVTAVTESETSQESETTPELESMPELEPMPESEPTPNPEPVIDEADYGTVEETAELEDTELVQPVDFGYVEETVIEAPTESGSAEETKIEDSVKSKGLADIDEDIAKIREIGYIEEKEHTRVKVIKKIKRNN